MNHTSTHRPSAFPRRTFLQGLASAGLLAALPPVLRAQAGPPWTAAVLKYLRTLARPDGGFAWADQQLSHLTTTFAALGCHQLLKADVPDKKTLAEFVRQAHPQRKRKPEHELHGFELQQVQCLVWLGQDASELVPRIKSWTSIRKYPPQYEVHGWPILQQEIATYVCRKLLAMPTDDVAPAFASYLDERRRPNGSFNHTPASDGSDGHVTNTLWCLQVMQILGRLDEKRQETIAFLRSCQLPSGGFTYAPKAQIGAVDDVLYTWAAVRALLLLGAAPADSPACVAYLHSLYNPDGGFGDRPAWASSPVATYYALDALAALEALEQAPAGRLEEPPAIISLPDDLKVFSIQIEAPGRGSPADAVELAHALRIHLWGAKNPQPGWIARAQAIADARKIPVTFFVANEEYGTACSIPGLGTYTHISDIIAPPNVDFGSSLAKQQPLPWPQFRQRRLIPLEKAGGRLIWQFGENEEFCRAILDDSLQHGGYAAISTFHFGNPDFITSQPFLYRYRHHLPFVALQDAHGDAWWWGDQLTGFRTVFLAKEPTWQAWLQALKNNWVASIRHDAVTDWQTHLHGGAPGVLEFIRKNEAQWKWWSQTSSLRPALSLVILTPDDAAEPGRPDKGLALRLRLWHDNTAQGLLKKPVAELVKLTLDGQAVSPKLVEQKNPRGLVADRFHLYAWPTPTPGRHSAAATVRLISSGIESTRTIEFDA